MSGWTSEADDALRGHWAEGHSTAEIGRRMGKTKNAVVGRAHRLNLTSRPSPIRGGKAAAEPRAVRPSRAGRPAGTRPRVTLAPVLPAEPPAPPAPHPAMRYGKVGCRWPLGEPRTPGFRFCDAAEVVPGKPYCSAHCAKAYDGAPRASAFVFMPRQRVAA